MKRYRFNAWVLILIVGAVLSSPIKGYSASWFEPLTGTST